MNKTNQRERILYQLKKGNQIGIIWGVTTEPPILNVKARVEELRREGHNIISIKRMNRDNTWSPTCEYIMRRFFLKGIHKEFFND